MKRPSEQLVLSSEPDRLRQLWEETSYLLGTQLSLIPFSGILSSSQRVRRAVSPLRSEIANPCILKVMDQYNNSLPPFF